MIVRFDEPLEHSLANCIIKRIEDIGKAITHLKEILDCDLFDDLSKHSNYWDSEHNNEADKLDDIRLKLSFLEENLWDVYAILENDSFV
jgi:hypothetical protein